MDQKYHLIKQLIDKVAEYEMVLGSSAEMNLEGFTRFMLPPAESAFVERRKLSGPFAMDVQEKGNKQETTIAILVTFIYRYAKLYAKKVLHDSAISSLDDFSYVILLLTHESLSKTELIQKNVHEKTTGMEIIKRLIKQNLIHQFDDLDDKRSQRVAITPQGRAAIFSILHKLDDVSTLMTGTLSAMEKNNLNAILKKLDHFHFDIFIHDRHKTLPEIIGDKLPTE
jgi:DNA-binding MarR family transcriptional regulator